MFDLIARLLSFFYDINNSYVLAIVLLTLVVLVIATPLTIQGTRSMLRLQILQPELKAIQSKYGKDEREAMNEELMVFYKENNINPVGGCLPMLFQIPVFLVLYRVILGLTRRATDVGFQFGAVAGSIGSGTEADAFESMPELQPFNPAFLSEDSQLFQDLSTSNEMQSLGFDVARSASSVVSSDFISSIPYLILILVVGVSGFVQHRMIRARQTGGPVNPTQDMVMKVIPFFLPIFSFTLPAAIVFYFLVSNLYRIAQQWYITRSFYTGDDSLGSQVRKARSDKDGDDGKGGGKGKGGGGNNKGGGGKGGSGKGGGGKGGNNRNGSSNKGNNKNGHGKNGKNGNNKNGNGKNGKGGGTKTKTKPVAARATSAPGRNSSGKAASARTQVQPRARKKKKR